MTKLKPYMNRVPVLYCAAKINDGLLQRVDPKVYLKREDAEKRVQVLNAHDLKKLSDPGKRPISNTLFLKWEARELIGFIETQR